MNKNMTVLAEKLKKPLLYCVIGLFGVSAFLGIMFILFSPDALGGKVIATTTLLGFLALFSLNNLNRLSDDGGTKWLSAVALISNLFWCVPWVLLVWGVFEKMFCSGGYDYYNFYASCATGYQAFLDMLWKVVWVAANVSFVCTLTANFLKMKDYNQAIAITKLMGIGTMAFISAALSMGVLFDNWKLIGDMWQLLAIMGITFVFCSITASVLHSVMGRREKIASVQPATAVDIAAVEREVRDRMRSEMEQKIRAEVEAEMRAKNEAAIDDVSPEQAPPQTPPAQV